MADRKIPYRLECYSGTPKEPMYVIDELVELVVGERDSPKFLDIYHINGRDPRFDIIPSKRFTVTDELYNCALGYIGFNSFIGERPEMYSPIAMLTPLLHHLSKYGTDTRKFTFASSVWHDSLDLRIDESDELRFHLLVEQPGEIDTELKLHVNILSHSELESFLGVRQNE